jgi:hypothetical protein
MPIFVLHCRNCEAVRESLILPHEPIECSVCKAREVDKVPAVTAGHVWKPGHSVDNPRKPWAGKPHREDG